jgi:hypothetical protein
VIACDVHALSEIKPVRTVALDSGIQMKLLATVPPGFFGKPLHHFFSMVPGTRAAFAYQIVDI